MKDEPPVRQKLIWLSAGLLASTSMLSIAIGVGELQNREICALNGKTWEWRHKYTWADGCLVWIEGKWVKLGNAYDPNDRN
jgi:hypothetical protein